MTENKFLKRDPGYFTKVIHGGFDPDDDQWSGLAPPISTSAVYAQKGPGEYREFIYTRLGSPIRKILEKSLADLDGAKYALCYPAGVGALTAIFSLLKTGDHVVAGEELYGGTGVLLKEIFSRMGIATSFVDTCNPINVKKGITKHTKIVLVETPTNPLLKMSDIQAISDIVHSYEDILLVVDNTFLTPYFQQPLKLGADIATYSISKYMNGHIDVVMGSIATNNEDLYKRLRFHQHAMGLAPSSFDCYLVNRSLKTLPLRMDHHMKSGLEIAEFLETQPLIQKVIHPGLPTHPQHELVKKQCYGISGMLSFYLRGGLEEAKLFIKSLKLIKYAPSLGGYGTTLLLPALMTHTSIPVKVRERLGITDNMIRMTVGFESVDDIKADITQALEALANKVLTDKYCQTTL